MNFIASGTEKIPSIMSLAFIFNPLRSMLAFAWDKSGVANIIMLLALLFMENLKKGKKQNWDDE